MSNGEKDFTESKQPTRVSKSDRIVGGLRSNNTIINVGVIEGQVFGSEGYIANDNGVLQGSLDARWVDLYDSKVIGPITATEQISMDTEARVEGIVKARFLSQSGSLTGKMVISDVAIFSKDSYSSGNLKCSFVNIELGARVNGYFYINGGVISEEVMSALQNVKHEVALSQKASMREDIALTTKSQPANLDISLKDSGVRARSAGIDTSQLSSTKTGPQVIEKTVVAATPIMGQTTYKEPKKSSVSSVKEPKEEPVPLAPQGPQGPQGPHDQDTQAEEIGEFISQSNNLVNGAIIILLILLVVLIVLVVMKYVFA